MSFTPKKLEGRTYTLCGKKFELYSLEGFSFNEEISIASLMDTDKGLYCFTYSYKIKHTEDGKHFEYSHTPLYLGMSTQIEDRPLNKSHEKWPFLKKDNCNCLGIYLSKDRIKEQETSILETYFFKENKKENEEIGNRKTTLVEDQITSLTP